MTEGPKHVFECIKTTRYLSKPLLAVIDPVIERNAFFAHPESVLLTMALDEREHIKELGLRRILKARQNLQKGKSIRSFMTPKLNFDASDYSEIIQWSSCKVTSPPLLRDITDKTLSELIKTREKPDWKFDVFPCHTQVRTLLNTIINYEYFI